MLPCPRLPLGVLKECKQSVAAELDPLDDIASSISAGHVENVLAEIDPVDSSATRLVANYVLSSCCSASE